MTIRYLCYGSYRVLRTDSGPVTIAEAPRMARLRQYFASPSPFSNERIQIARLALAILSLAMFSATPFAFAEDGRVGSGETREPSNVHRLNHVGRVALNDEVGSSIGGIFQRYSSPMNARERKQFLDRALRPSDLNDATRSFANTTDPVDAQVGSADGLDAGEILRSADPDDLAAVNQAKVEVVINPEPSSLVIWSAVGAGLWAARHGYRRRQSETL